MRTILIPVKDLSCAKQRLAPLLTQPQRTELAWAMLEGTFDAVSRVAGVDAIAIVTSYAPAIALANFYGFEVIVETEQISESASVDFASSKLQSDGIKSVLRIPIDIPLITTEDVETIIAADVEAPCCVIVPSRDGTGTNALLRRPPTLFRSHFGPGSYEKHVSEARRMGARFAILEIPRIALDIDDPDDIEELGRIGRESAVYKLLISKTSLEFKK
jgi:2-phospho-L-lactate guanylyltransferase